MVEAARRSGKVPEAGCAVRRHRARYRLDGVVGEDQAEAGVVGPLVVDLELEGVVQLALDLLGRLGDGDLAEDR
jgi:hypothetical protein